MPSERQGLLDRPLDAALQEYGSIEPHAGLEARVLVRLQDERETWTKSWIWRWAVAGIAAALVVGTLFIGRWIQSPPTPLAKVVVAPPVSKTPRSEDSQPVRTEHRHTSTDVGATRPKRERFPSPSPLSEQEQILARYVDEHYQRAVLIARAQADLTRRDAEEDALSDKLRFGNPTTNREKEGIQ